MAAGNYSVTATAIDSTGTSKTSASVLVKISKSLKGVRNGRDNAASIDNSVALTLPSLANNTGQTNAAQALVAELNQTYRDFIDERSMFVAAPVINKYLFAAMFLAKSSLSLSTEQTPSSALNDRLKKVSSYLTFCEDLMVDGTISSATIAEGNRVNAPTNISIGFPDVVPIGLPGFNVLPNQIARISAPLGSPFSTQTAAGDSGGSFELADVSVSIGGQAARILTVSPTEISIVVPGGLSGGVAEVVVTSRERFIHFGLAGVVGLNPMIFGSATDSGSLGAVVDSFGLRAGPFDMSSSLAIGLDGRTRLSILATGLSSGLVNIDRNNDVWLANGQMLENLAEVVTVKARKSDGTVIELPVEYAGVQGTIRGIDQVVVVLVPELAGAGSVELTITAAGITSTAKTVVIN